MSLKLDGKKLSLEIEERLADYISNNKIIAKRAPGLAVIRIGEDPASGVYVNNKGKACSRVGIKSFIFHLKDNVCLLYTSPSPRDKTVSRMPSSA